jgi:hypothetical protein
MSSAAQRQRSYRRRRTAGRSVRFVETDDVILAAALVEEKLLTEAEAESSENLNRGLAKIVAAWLARYA